MFQSDRYSTLREILKRPLKGTLDNIVLLLREIGYAVLILAEDVNALRSIPGALARIEKHWLEYAEESLAYRQRRMEKEGDHTGAMSTQDAIQKLQERNKRLSSISVTNNMPTIPAPQPAPNKIQLNWSQILSAIAGGVLTIIVLRILNISFGDVP